MIKIVSTVICFAFAIPALSQKEHVQTLVLNNGSCLTGIIVNDSSENYYVRITAPQVIAVPKAYVNSVEKISLKEHNLSQKNGYYLHLAASILAGKSKQGNTNIISISLSNGYKFSNGLMIGIGSGIEDMDMPLLPVYAEFRYHPFNSRVSPFIYLKSGYGFSLAGDENADHWYGYTKESEGGMLFNTGAGIVLFTRERAGVNIALGYRFQKVSTSEHSRWTSSSYSTEYGTRFNRLELQFGFVFR